MDSVQKQGVVVLDDLNKTRLELLTKIKDPQIVIVLSTHGTPQDALDYTNTHFKQFYDLTCTNLLNNFNMIRRLIKQGYRIIYYGTNGHPETQTVMSFSPYIQLIESPADAQKIK
jgi:4-hydroxy-3-methylbut-2-enyl diphosphate reductase